MTTLFWLLEYGRVFIAYAVLVFVWPSLLFYRFLKDKSAMFRFGFCTTVSVLILNAVVLMFGLIGLLKPWLFRVLFFGSIAVAGYFAVPDKKKTLKQAGRVILGTYGLKQLSYNAYSAVMKRVKGGLRKLWDSIEGRRGEYLLLGLLLLYGMIYFSYGTFHDYSYGCSDMYPHNAWIYGLTQGQVFSAGVYPEGMHCFLYSMHVLFGIRIYSCLLFTAGVHILTILLSAYCLFREIFRSRYTPLLALALFLTVDMVCTDGIYSMSRLQWTIPQEFGFYAVFLCGAFLVRYLRSSWQDLEFLDSVYYETLRRLHKLIFNEELLVFMMALAVTLTVHFYPTIMAFFICLAFVPMAIRKIFDPKRLIPLVLAVTVGCLVAIMPMCMALVSGIPFQGSIGWAINVINGTNGENQGNTTEDKTQEHKGTDGASSGRQVEVSEPGASASVGPAEAAGGTQAAVSAEAAVGGLRTATSLRAGDTAMGTGTGVAIAGSVFKSLGSKGITLYETGYDGLYPGIRGALLVIMTVFAVIIFVFCRIGIFRRRLEDDEEEGPDAFDGYFALALCSVFFMVMYAAPELGLPALIEPSRLACIIQLLMVGVCVVPADVLFLVLENVLAEGVMTKVSWICAAGVYLGTMLTGTYHGYLYFDLTRYNGAVMTTLTITERLPKYSYTVVSTVDELYQMIEYGYHEEAVKFINDVVDNDYTLPSEYVFVYVEKHPIEYAQRHFFGGPKWLAWEKYPAYYEAYVSQCPRISNATISPELAEAPFYRYPISSRAYIDLLSRVVVESRIQKWCDDFDRLYPNEMHTYYEDENFVCYYFRQNPACLYQLGIQ